MNNDTFHDKQDVSTNFQRYSFSVLMLLMLHCWTLLVNKFVTCCLNWCFINQNAQVAFYKLCLDFQYTNVFMQPTTLLVKLISSDMKHLLVKSFYKEVKLVCSIQKLPLRLLPFYYWPGPYLWNHDVKLLHTVYTTHRPQRKQIWVSTQ